MADGDGDDTVRPDQSSGRHRPQPPAADQASGLHAGIDATTSNMDLDGDTSSESGSESSTSSSIHSFMFAPTPANTMIPNHSQSGPLDTSVSWNETGLEHDDITGLASTSEGATSTMANSNRRLPVPTFHSPSSDEVDDLATLPRSHLPVPPPPLIRHNSATSSSFPAMSPNSLKMFPSGSGIGGGDTASTTGLDSTGMSSVNMLASSTSTQASRIALLGFRRHRRSSTPSPSLIGLAPRVMSSTTRNKYLSWLGLRGHSRTASGEESTENMEAPSRSHSMSQSMHTTGGRPMSAEDIQKERDRKRLEQLGYSEVLGRDYGFWACFSVAFCNIGVSCFLGRKVCAYTVFFADPVLFAATIVPSRHPSRDFRDIYLRRASVSDLQATPYRCRRRCRPCLMIPYSMILTMWPASALVMITITLSMGELASAFPVAGAMSSWAWKCARGGVRGERYWGWAVNGITMGFHISVVRNRSCPNL
jgi:hypothetical protein